jgi:ATP-dependent helicase HepA
MFSAQGESMQDFVPGQRWISDTEMELGLGTVMRTDARTVTVFFHAGGEMRTYARHNAPLSRVAFTRGDSVQSHEGWTLHVQAVENAAGLLTYVGRRTDTHEETRLSEGGLSNFLQLNKPKERLLTGHTDPAQWFTLRYETLAIQHRIMQTPVRGLCGARVDLIPHQLYLAWEVANRYAPRVLLADEVGLGKTIEAGLILHQQLLSGRATRVLLLTPETLVHQWLVEMRRRFNLCFSIFDHERLEGEIGEAAASRQGNPFEEEQLVLCSLDYLVRARKWQSALLAAEWDVLVVDEAQHLVWTERRASPEYLLVEQLAKKIPGVLLLTATPEQLGKAGHFARLRLLDPERFFDYGQFLEEESQYEPVAEAAQHLLDGKKLSAKAAAHLAEALGETDSARVRAILNPASAQKDADDLAEQRLRLLEDLLDRHGTGRVLFRNTRAAIGGFPERHAHFYPLPLPEQYRTCLNHVQNVGGAGRLFLLNPELCYQAVLEQTPLDDPEDGLATVKQIPSWWRFDPRLPWLFDKLVQLRGEKVLVICAHQQLALDIDQALRGAGIRSSAFHEALSLVQRDRAAAYFASEEDGARVLVCSEIGSEGRNFQFAHHLILFDLPLNPDVLEQRIGRLDRIGQRHPIEIHVPYLQDSPQAILCQWYNEGLNAFAHTCPAGHAVYVQIREQLLQVLDKSVHATADADAALADLIAASRDLAEEINIEMQRGRDRLLELHSCHPAKAAQLSAAIAAQDADDSLAAYLERVCDIYGVNVEEHSPHCLLLTPGDNMLAAGFPALGEDGVVMSYDRATALSREEVLFLTWEHPMSLGVIDLVLGSGLGNTALNALKHPALRAGTLLLEAVYVYECIAPRRLQANRFLPPTPVRVVVDSEGVDLSAVVETDACLKVQSVDKETARRVIQSQLNKLRHMTDVSAELAQARVVPLQETALAAMRQNLDTEITRLRALREINPNVRKEEIELLEAQREELEQSLSTAQLRLDALRVLVAT